VIRVSSAQTVAAATGSEFAAMENPLAGPVPAVEVPTDKVLDFHRRLPGYEPTPLLSVPALAERLGVASVLVKEESSRFGLPAFKMLGASWAVYRALAERLGADLEPWRDVDELATRLSAIRPFTLAAATDGNHGRAVARMARFLGLGARIFVPAGTSHARVAAIAGEGAEVVVVPGNYDAAVARCAQEEGSRAAVISDTSWAGYSDVPRWVTEGYSTMFNEIDDALAAAGRRQPDAVVVPIGVGALAAAAVEHAQRHGGRASLVGVEPTDAACAAASALAGGLVTLEGEQHSIMAGLNCGTPSRVAWPLVSRGMAGFLAIGDEWARRAVRELAAVGVEAGETGAAALGGLDALREHGAAGVFERVLSPSADVLLLVTEGASDLGAWRRILGVDVVGAP
jgi:diaminopropionate ammonia-lyase